MKTTMSTGLRLAAWSSAGLLMMGTAAGTASAVTGHHQSHDGQGSDSDPGGQGGPQGGGPGGQGGPQGAGHVMPGLVHSLSTVKVKGKYRTIKAQVGTINEVNSEAVVVTSSDEYSSTYVLGENTKITKNCKTIKAGKLSEGDKVTVIAKKKNGKFLAGSISEGQSKAPMHGGDGNPS
jgi:hypothetical protein